MATSSFPTKFRASHSKSRSGCRTCKHVLHSQNCRGNLHTNFISRIRRVKCGEEHPECLRCTSTGRKCDGYQPPQRRWIAMEPLAVNQLLPALSAQPPQYLADEASRSCFGFFRDAAALELSRFSDRGFWCKSVLQAAHHSATICHAVLAIAGLHRSVKVPSSLIDQYPETQYTLALRCLAGDISSSRGARGQTTILICAVLFVTFEVLRDNELAALKHLDSAVDILSNNKTSKSKDSGLDELARILARLDLDASMYLGIRAPGLPILDEAPHTNDMQFSSLDEGSDASSLLLRRATLFKRSVADNFRYRRVGDVPLEIFDQRNGLVDDYQRIDRQLHVMSSSNNLKPMDADRLSVLQIQIKMGLTMAHGCLHVEETMYDALEPIFREIVQLCKSLLRDQSQSAETFALERGLIHPLYWTVLKCRDGRMRRKALALMRKCPREGVWIAGIQARVAERVIEIEEDAFRGRDCRQGLEGKTYGDIPEFYRIHSVDLTFNKPRRLIQMTYQRRLNGLDGEWDIVQEILNY